MGRSTAAAKAAFLYTNKQIVEAATGRWGEAANEIKLAEPYVITKPDGTTIEIPPLTRRRRKRLKEAQAAYIMLGAQIAQIQQENTADQGAIDRMNKVMEEADETYNRALFTDELYQDVVDYYENLQEEFWDAFYEDIHEALVNRVQLPEDSCPKCGQKLPTEEGGEGKDESSSTSSTDTGTKSTGTSAKS
jgi:DNA repair exonuclease SbcCD ATPase subunit